MTNFTPLEYIKIDIANQYGKDRILFPARIKWVDGIKDLRKLTKKAKKPAQYLAAVMALEDALAGRSTGHLVGLDACASGITILGILTGCHTTSKNTGVIGQKRMDMYSECNKEMNRILEGESIVDRESTKEAQMVHYYGSKAEPKRIFGEDTLELEAFYHAQEKVAPGACHMMVELLDSWQPFALEHKHTLPDGFNSVVPVLQKFKEKIEVDELDGVSINYIYEDNVGTERGLAVAANATHAVDGFLVRELSRRCNYDKEYLLMKRELLQRDDPQQSQHPMELTALAHGFISLRGIDIITERNLFMFSANYRSELVGLIDEVLKKPAFQVITIHDEFKCHPNYVNDLRKVYRGILAELADSTVGECIIRELRNDPTYTLYKYSQDLGDEIMKAEYFLS